MRKSLTVLLFIFATFLAGGTAARLNNQPPANRRNFIACPIVRDTKTLPCWLAEYEGELYFLGLQGSSASEFYPPQLNHEVLVEGTVANQSRVCGGIPLKPVRISVIAELNRACNTLCPPKTGRKRPPLRHDAAPTTCASLEPKRRSVNSPCRLISTAIT